MFGEEVLELSIRTSRSQCRKPFTNSLYANFVAYGIFKKKKEKDVVEFV